MNTGGAIGTPSSVYAANCETMPAISIGVCAHCTPTSLIKSIAFDRSCDRNETLFSVVIADYPQRTKLKWAKQEV